MFEWFEKYKVAVVIGSFLLVLLGVFFWGYSTGRKVGLVEMANEVDTIRGELTAIKAGVNGQGETIRTLQTSLNERDGLIAERERIIEERESLERERQDITENLKAGESRNLELIEFGESISGQIRDDIQQYLDREPGATGPD